MMPVQVWNPSSVAAIPPKPKFATAGGKKLPPPLHIASPNLPAPSPPLPLLRQLLQDTNPPLDNGSKLRFPMTPSKTHTNPHTCPTPNKSHQPQSAAPPPTHPPSSSPLRRCIITDGMAWPIHPLNLHGNQDGRPRSTHTSQHHRAPNRVRILPRMPRIPPSQPKPMKHAQPLLAGMTLAMRSRTHTHFVTLTTYCWSPNNLPYPSPPPPFPTATHLPPLHPSSLPLCLPACLPATPAPFPHPTDYPARPCEHASSGRFVLSQRCSRKRCQAHAAAHCPAPCPRSQPKGTATPGRAGCPVRPVPAPAGLAWPGGPVQGRAGRGGGRQQAAYVGHVDLHACGKPHKGLLWVVPIGGEPSEPPCALAKVSPFSPDWVPGHLQIHIQPTTPPTLPLPPNLWSGRTGS